MSLSKYYDWWFDDYNPLDGRLRFIFYFLLLYLAYTSLLPGAINRISACPESYFAAVGIMQLVIPATVSAAEVATFLSYAVYAVIFFWLCSAIGLFGRISPIITAAGVFLFWGSMQSCAGTGHDWHLPMYTLIFLGLFSKNDTWSADYWLSTKFDWYPFRNFSTNKWGGFARKLILLTTVFILFAGGIAKLFTGGLAWLNGETLYFYLKEFNQPSYAIGPVLLDFFLENKWIITFLSIWTVILELSSVFILFKKNWRLFYVLNLWAFHIGIYLLMFPKYFPSMVCYLLIVNWRHTFQVMNKNFGNLIKGIPFHAQLNRLSAKKVRAKKPTRGEATRRILFPSVLSFVFIVTIIFRVEVFPLTYVPMYSTIVTEEKIGNFDRADFTSRESLVKVAQRYTSGENPWYLMFYYPRNIEIRMWYREDPDAEIITKDVTDEYGGLINNWFKWYQVVTDVTLYDLSREKLFVQVEEENSSETENILSEIKAILKTRGGYEHIEKVALIYHFNDDEEEVMLQLN